MPRLISLVLISLLSAAGLAAAGVTKVLQCGASQYDPAHYTCFDGDFLCPIHDPHGYSDADVLLRCGDNCYSTNDSTCNGTSVVPLQIGENPLEDCGPRARFYAQDYVCIDGDLLCPIVNHLGYLRCGKACYDPFSYNEHPSPVDAPRATRSLRFPPPVSARTSTTAGVTTRDAAGSTVVRV
ncbi:unnamed protein product [Mycena citricolor]|uniref:Endo-1,3(4)-beta-glucanase 1 carbohydrate binding domain-containing protein n=1 Tax=Mycena citricolor TaxID=2018698 RepID=A0AAD2H6A3_9AGAR|nr:unnamed protein product [Mycena citricolor]